jgi:hypothetical protein
MEETLVFWRSVFFLSEEEGLPQKQNPEKLSFCPFQHFTLFEVFRVGLLNFSSQPFAKTCSTWRPSTTEVSPRSSTTL